MNLRKLIVIFIIIAGVVGLIIFDLSRPTSKIRVLRLNYFVGDNLNDEQLFEERSLQLREQEEKEELNAQLSSVAGIFDRLEGNRVHFRVPEEIEVGGSIYLNFSNRVAVINEDSTFFRMVLAPQEDSGVINRVIQPRDLRASDEIIIYTFPGDISLDEIPIQSLYINF